MIEIDFPSSFWMIADILGDLMTACEPHIAPRMSFGDEFLQQTHARRSATEPRVQREHEAAAEVVHRLELAPPEVEDLCAVLRDEAPRGLSIEGELLPVFQHPLAWDFDEAVRVRVGHVVSHHAGVVEEAKLLQQVRRAGIDLKPRRAEADGSLVGDAFENAHALLQHRAFFVRR